MAQAGRRLITAYGQLSSSARWLIATHLSYITNVYLTSIFIGVYLWRQADDFLFSGRAVLVSDP